jgi:hypothetical protein
MDAGGRAMQGAIAEAARKAQKTFQQDFFDCFFRGFRDFRGQSFGRYSPKHLEQQ